MNDKSLDVKLLKENEAEGFVAGCALSRRRWDICVLLHLGYAALYRQFNYGSNHSSSAH